MDAFGKRVLVSVFYLGKTGSMKRRENELQKNLASEPFSSCKVFNMPKSPAWRGGVGLMF